MLKSSFLQGIYSSKAKRTLPGFTVLRPSSKRPMGDWRKRTEARLGVLKRSEYPVGSASVTGDFICRVVPLGTHNHEGEEHASALCSQTQFCFATSAYRLYSGNRRTIMSAMFFVYLLILRFGRYQSCP